MARRGFCGVALRERLAQEAARLIVEHGIQDYGQAKRKAAARFGVREAGVLPSNAEIESSVTEWQRIFEPEAHGHRLEYLRRVAADTMGFLSPFQPRLVGPVLNGAVTVNSSIELHLFTDSPESVALVLEQRGVPYRDCQRRYRYNGRGVSTIPGFRFSKEGEQVFAIIFPEKGVRQAPVSPVDGRPMRRAARGRVLALLGSSG